MEQYEAPSRLATDHSIDGPTDFNTRDFFKEHLVRTDEGSYESAKVDDLGPVELALLETEKRRRGSQAAENKERVRADRARSEVNHLKKELPKMDPSRLAPQVEQTLKYSDPDEYIRQTLEAKQTNPYDEVFDTAEKQAAEEVGQRTIESEIALFNKDNPQIPVTMAMLEMDVPPRLINEFTKGQLAPQDFLSQAADILYRPTETFNEVLPVTPDLGSVGGQTSPSDDGSNDKMMAEYASAIF